MQVFAWRGPPSWPGACGCVGSYPGPTATPGVWPGVAPISDGERGLRSARGDQAQLLQDRHAVVEADFLGD
jgi:hypothetical protein